MAAYNPRLVAGQANTGNPSFADHSAVNDIVSSSFKRKSLLEQGIIDNQMLELVQAATNPTYNTANTNGNANPIAPAVVSGSYIVGANASTKSVSFSHTNQTIDADNTIRKSSVTVAIVKSPALDEKDEDYKKPDASLVDKEAAALISAAAMNAAAAGGEGNASSAVTSNTSIPIPMSAGAMPHGHANLSSSQRPGLNANLHLEMASLAHSISQVNPTRVLAASARQQSVVSSVRSLLIGPSTLRQFEGADSEAQQELFDKAVIVIKRVMDKLTGLDFAEGQQGQPSQQQQIALAVSEQVDRLIREATSNENLSQSFFGWCPFW